MRKYNSFFCFLLSSSTFNLHTLSGLERASPHKSYINVVSAYLPLFVVSLLLFGKLKAYLENLFYQVLHRSGEECHMLL